MVEFKTHTYLIHFNTKYYHRNNHHGVIPLTSLFLFISRAICKFL